MYEKVMGKGERKRKFKCGFRFGFGFEDRTDVVNLMGKLRCSGQHRHVERAIKQYTMCSDANRVMEQKE